VIKDTLHHLTPKPKLSAKTIVHCLICGEKQAINKMREHVGTHILLSQWDIIVEEPLLKPVGVDQCGFCGLDGCITQLTISKEGKHSVKSSCQYHYNKMQYKAAKASSNRSPCTNIPLHCAMCPKAVTGIQRTFWKYNASYHLASEH
ncbi:hypothetical protein C8J57DRAFT_1036595, partial [Mycena rebaudengoi]